MSSMMSSQGLVLATAMAVSAGTVILLDHFREKYFPTTHLLHSSPEKQILKSCLSSSGGKNKGTKNKQKKKKRVHFADDVKESNGNGDDYRKRYKKSTEIQIHMNSCGKKVLGMPANRLALYNGILKNRVQRMGFSY